MEDLDRAHSAFPADRTFAHVETSQSKQGILPCFGLVFRIVLLSAGQKFPALIEFLLSASVPQKSVVSDLDEPVRQYMKQEPPDELVGIHGHDLGLVVVGVIPPPERDRIILHLHDPVIADRDPVSVPPEIIKNAFGPIERRF